MALEKYKEKRNFEKSPEPTGGKPHEKLLRFVVQKHNASHLHYDFRLELRGVLKSWAVPKGLSMNPAEARLAMLVEDHPWDYRSFEGVIPSGYGAGTVIVWDEGTYQTNAISEIDKKSQEHSISGQFWKGSIKLVLHGKKLKGAFVITRSKEKNDNAWYMRKVKDEYASVENITLLEKSVLSGRTLEQVSEKPARIWESHRPDSANKLKKTTINTNKISEKKKINTDNNWYLVENEKLTSKEIFTIDGKELMLNNVEKELWKNVPKAALFQYYHKVASYILPYLKDRPQSLHIKQINASSPGFYIKDMNQMQPPWAEIFTVKRKHLKKGKSEIIDYLICNNEATLIYMINLGCIDINPCTARSQNYLTPDFIVIDLDPSDNDFKKVIEVGKAAKLLLDNLKLKSFPKTSGKTGLHIFIPCEKLLFKEARTLAEIICKKIQALVPEISTTENTISKRGDKLFIDFNQNDEMDTVAAPYSVRPAKRPTVSTPLAWSEINEKLDMNSFDFNTIFNRIEKKGDLFKKVLDPTIRKKNTVILKKILSEKS